MDLRSMTAQKPDYCIRFRHDHLWLPEGRPRGRN